MKSTTRDENKDLEAAYLAVYGEEADQASTGDKVVQAANIKKEVEKMKEQGEEVPEELETAAAAADEEIADTVDDLNSDDTSG